MSFGSRTVFNHVPHKLQGTKRTPVSLNKICFLNYRIKTCSCVNFHNSDKIFQSKQHGGEEGITIIYRT